MSIITRITNQGKLKIADEIIEYVAELEGGRNLLRNTSGSWTELVRPEGDWYYEKGADYQVEVGETYTFSVIVEKVSDDNVPINLHLGVGLSQGSYNKDIGDWRKNNIPFGEKVSITHTIRESDLDNSSGRRIYFAWRLRNERLATTIRFKEVKLEKGNKATDWAPAPEDLGLDYPDDIQHFSTGFRSDGRVLVRELIEGDLS